MTESDWQRIKDLFAEAIELPTAERETLLSERCGGDAELLREVGSLLAASTEPENLIESNAINLAARVGAKESDKSGQLFGNYRIIREIGSGGMGTVFLAERDDGEFTMRVALKIVRQSVVDRDVIARFRRERQILAGLNHPNIAVLHDGGLSEKGEPYLAMEYVDGDTLIDYANNVHLTIEQKLRLFQKVCSAVSYAHRNLVVHRDIKPSNILVTVGGEPKLLDFGLAKAFEADGSMTQTVLRAFTPAYASPEQIQGGSITTVSDIYSLGVVFYELLTGRKPLNVENRSYDEIVHTIKETVPLKPSSVEPAAADHETGRRLRGDLDNIALMALRKRPERRYKTVEDLSEDIDRHLTGRPISARPNTSAYLIGKFIRRNTISVAAAVVVILALIAAVAVSLWQADKARQERDRAEKRFQDVRQLSNSLLFEISPKIEHLPGSVEAREMLVQRALEYLDSLAAESSADAGLRFELASAYEKVGELQGNIDKPNLSDYAGAVASLEKARAIRQTLPDSSDNQFRLAQNLRVASQIRNRQNDVKGAIGDAERSKEIFAALLQSSPGTAEYRTAAAEAEVEHAQIYSLNNQYKEAIPIFRQAAIRIASLDQSNVKTRQVYAKNQAFLSSALSWDGQQEEAVVEMTRAVDTVEALEREFPNDSEVQATAWQTYAIASSIYEDSEDELSLSYASRALATAVKQADADKADLQAIFNVARSYSRVGIIQAKSNRLAEATESLQSAEKIFSELIEREPKNVIYQRDLAKLYVRMGDASEMRKDLQDALLKYQNSAVIFDRLAAGDSLNTLVQRDLAQSLKSVGKIQIALSQTANARMSLQRAKDILIRLKEMNALGGYDQNLIDEVDKALASI